MSDVDALFEALMGCGVTEITDVEEAIMNSEKEKLAKLLAAQAKLQFQKALMKGLVLHKMMLADDHLAGQMFPPPRDSAASTFIEVAELEDWGYVGDTARDLSQTLLWTCIGNVLETIGLSRIISDDFGNNSPVNHEHKNNSVIGGTLYQPTYALFSQVINPVDGVIVAHDNLSPMEALKDAGITDRRVPDLKFWSDVAFLQWKWRASDDSELKYVLRYNVMNGLTNLVVEAINSQNKTTTGQWPGTSYNAVTKECQALLGSPNGSSVAYLLIQHKKQLGHKTVEKITVFNNPSSALMLLFHIKNVPEESRPIKSAVSSTSPRLPG